MDNQGIRAHHLHTSNPSQTLSQSLLKKVNCPENLVHLIKSLNTPEKIQSYMKKELKYHHNDTVRALPGVVKHKQADCFEGGIGFFFKETMPYKICMIILPTK